MIGNYSREQLNKDYSIKIAINIMVDFQINIYNDLSNAQIDLLNSFNKNKVRFIIIGGYAMIFHGSQRKTADLDLLVNHDSENVNNIVNSFKKLQSKNINIKKFLSSPQKKLTWFDVELITPEESWDFNSFYLRAITKEFNGIIFYFLSIKDSISLKEISNREKDIEDLKFLKSITG